MKKNKEILRSVKEKNAILLKKASQKLKMDKVLLKNRTNYKKVILRNSVDEVGAISIEDNVVTTRENEQYVIFEVIFLVTNGIDNVIDEENHLSLIEVINSLEHKVKILYIKEVKNELSSTMKFYKERLENEENESICEVLEERLRLMEIFNDTKYVTTLLFVHSSDIDNFKKISQGVYSLIEYSNRKVMKLLEVLNNGFE